MTKLNKPLKREVSIARIKRPIIISIDPETKILSLREKGARRGYNISIISLYALLVRESK